MPTRNVNLTDHHNEFVQNQIVDGQFQNASEVVRAGLRLLEQQAQEEAAKIAALHKMADEAFQAIDDGLGVTIEDPQALREWIRQVGDRASKKLAKRRRA